MGRCLMNGAGVAGMGGTQGPGAGTQVWRAGAGEETAAVTQDVSAARGRWERASQDQRRVEGGPWGCAQVPGASLSPHLCRWDSWQPTPLPAHKLSFPPPR